MDIRPLLQLLLGLLASCGMHFVEADMSVQNGELEGLRWDWVPMNHASGCPPTWEEAYHGTDLAGFRGIRRAAFNKDKSTRNRYGKGIYATRKPRVAKAVAEKKSIGQEYMAVLKVCVDPEKSERVHDDRDYRVFSEDGIRPIAYALLEVSNSELNLKTEL